MRSKSRHNQISEVPPSLSRHRHNLHQSTSGNDRVNGDIKEEKIPKILQKRWEIYSPIGSGSFGYIYQGKDLITDERVAIKFESKHSSYPQLFKESKMYRFIEGSGMPKMYWCGAIENYHAMVLEMLGPSLEDLFNYCHRQFSMKTVLLLGEQMLERIRHIHRRSVIHRDIKPDNFTMGIESKCQSVYLIDFGLSKWYLDRKTRQHIEYREGKSLTGTARYASLRTHAGIEQSRRDDLECLAYSLIYLARSGKPLPWQGIRADNKFEKQEKIYEKKLNTHVQILCSDLPDGFIEFLTYTRRLGFAEEPDYNYLLSLIKETFSSLHIKRDFVYDWIANKPAKIFLNRLHIPIEKNKK